METSESFHLSMQEKGFSVTKLLIDGRRYVDRGDLKQAIDIEPGESIFSPDLIAIKTRLEQLSWIRTATVERHLPDTIYIRLEERKPLALWQRKNKVSLVDAEGKILTDTNLARFRSLLMIVGEDAPRYAPDLVAMLAAEPKFGERVESAKRIGGRRWDLYLKNGVEVRLPEDDMGQAMKRLAEAQDDAKLLDRNVVAIDMRDPIRIIVQTAPGQAEEYQAAYDSRNKI